MRRWRYTLRWRKLPEYFIWDLVKYVQKKTWRCKTMLAVHSSHVTAPIEVTREWGKRSVIKVMPHAYFFSKILISCQTVAAAAEQAVGAEEERRLAPVIPSGGTQSSRTPSGRTPSGYIHLHTQPRAATQTYEQRHIYKFHTHTQIRGDV